MSKQLDFLALGDITTDAFIRLRDAHVHCRIDSDACELCVPFAEKIPYESVDVVRAVGNAPNAAVCAARLGLSVGLISDMGDDENGRECLTVLKKERVDSRYVTVHRGRETNYHFVLWYGDERTILIKHQAYDYKLPEIRLEPRFMYLSSFRGAERYRKEIFDYLAKHPAVTVAFQPGKFEIKLGVEELRPLYERTEFFCVNLEEAKIVAKMNAEPAELLSALHALGPKLVVITDGPRGAYASDGAHKWFMPPYPDPKPPLERTGAGDAFAATVASFLALGKSFEEALAAAPINSAYVVQQVGAQRGLLTKAELLEYLKKAPEDYKPKKI